MRVAAAGSTIDKMRASSETHTVSDDLVEIVKKPWCFPFKMDCDEVIKSHLDDNCVSNGPRVPLKPLDRIRQISADFPLSQNFHRNSCRISIKSEIVTKTALRSVHFELLPPTFQ